MDWRWRATVRDVYKHQEAREEARMRAYQVKGRKDFNYKPCDKDRLKIEPLLGRGGGLGIVTGKADTKW